MTQIIRSNALGAKVLKFIPFNSTEGEIVNGNALTLVNGTILNDTTFGPYLKGSGTGIAANIQLDLSGKQFITIAFRARDIQGKTIFGHAGDFGSNNNAFTLLSYESNQNVVVVNRTNNLFGGTVFDLAQNGINQADWHYHIVTISNDGRDNPFATWMVDGIEYVVASGFGNDGLGFTSGLLAMLEGTAGSIQNLAFFDGILSSSEKASLSSNPNQLTQVVAANTVVMSGVAQLMQVGREAPTITFQVNGTLSSSVVITPTAQNITFNPATITLTPESLTGTTVPTATAEGTSTLSITNNGGLTNPANVTIVTSNKIQRIVTTNQEFIDAAAWVKTLDPVALKSKVYISIDNNLSVSGVDIQALSSNEDYHIVVTPTTGKNHYDLVSSGALTYGSAGIELTLAVSQAIRARNGVRFVGLRMNVTASQGLLFQSGGAGIQPRLQQCKVKADAYNAIGIQAYQRAEGRASLFLRTIACGGLLVDGAWAWDTQGCTYALLPGGTASYAHSGGWGGDNGANMLGNLYKNFSTPVDGNFYSANNVSDSGGGAGITVGTPAVVDGTTDLRPGTFAIAKGWVGMQSTNDIYNKNRGLNPDAGAEQFTPSEDLVQLVATSQTFNAGTLTVSGTFTGNMSSGTMTLRPKFNSNGTPAKVQALIIDNVNKTFTITMTGIVRDMYQRPDLRGLNSGGVGLSGTGTTTFDYAPTQAAATANPTTVQPNYYQAKPATAAMNLTKLVQHVRGSTVIATYSELGDLLSKDSRYGGGGQAACQPGDQILVYPAVYDKIVWFGGFAGGVLEGVSVIGVVIDGVRPAMRWRQPGGSYGYDGGYGSGNGILYVADNKNCTWDGIDVLWQGGYLAKALVYCFNEQEGTVAFKNMRIMGAYRSGENGFLSAHGTKCGLTFDNVESGFNGGNGGPPPQGGGASLAHGYYITRHEKNPTTGAFPLVRWTGCFFHNAWIGHTLKVRNPNTLVEGCYFAGLPPSTLNDPALLDVIGPFTLDGGNASTASQFDMPNGGSVIIRNNIFTKNFTGYDEGTFMFNWAAESGTTALGTGSEDDPIGSIEIYNNTFVAFSDIATSFSSGTKNPPIPLGFPWFIAGGNPDSPAWPTTVPVKIRNNVYAGCQPGQWREQSAQVISLDEINLPGRDNAVPFTPKVPQGSQFDAGGASFPMYAHRATSVIRSDSNKGAMGLGVTGIAPTGFYKVPMWTPTRNIDQYGYTAIGGSQAYPYQAEWTDSTGGTIPPATAVSVSGAGAGIVGQASTIYITTDNALTGTQSVSIGLSDGASGTFSPATVTRTSASSSAAAVSYTPASAGAKTITATATGTPTLSNGTKAFTASAPQAPDTTPPSAVIVASPSNVTVAGAVTLTATATDAGGISKVEFYRNTTLLGTVTQSPFTFTDNVTSALNGTITYKAKAFDNALNTAEGTTAVVVNIQAQAPRSISLPLTTDGQTPVADMSGLLFSWFDQAKPDLFTAPAVKGNNAAIVGGVLSLSLPGSALPTGGVGCLVLTNSNGSPTQSPPALVFFGPVTVN